jgi:hypothetical protein
MQLESYSPPGLGLQIQKIQTKHESFRIIEEPHDADDSEFDPDDTKPEVKPSNFVARLANTESLS